MRTARAIGVIVGDALFDVREDACIEPCTKVLRVGVVVGEDRDRGEDGHGAQDALATDSTSVITFRATTKAHAVAIVSTEK